MKRIGVGMTGLIMLAVTGLVAAARAQPSFQFLMGKATAIAGDQIRVVSTSSTLLFADKDSRIWRGKMTNTLSAVQPGDRVMVKYRREADGRLVILELYANLEHITGKITKIGIREFEVDQNHNADPQSAYKRQIRQIRFDSDTQWELSAPEDLRVGRDVDIQAVTGEKSHARASRVTVYEGNRPVRMPANARVVTPNGRPQ
jgi:hypothetical protein